MRKRGEIVERSFAHVLERGGMRRTWLRGRENVHKRYLRPCRRLQSRHPDARAVRSRHAEGEAAIRNAVLFVIQGADTIAFVLAAFDAEIAALVIAIARDAG